MPPWFSDCEVFRSSELLGYEPYGAVTEGGGVCEALSCHSAFDLFDEAFEEEGLEGGSHGGDGGGSAEGMGEGVVGVRAELDFEEAVVRGEGFGGERLEDQGLEGGRDLRGFF